MRPEIDVALDECLEEMRRGCDIQQCLNRYPEYAAELRPLLETVVRVGRVLTPPAMEEARVAGRERMLAALAKRRASGTPRRPWQRLPDSITLPRPIGLAPAWRLAALAHLTEEQRQVIVLKFMENLSNGEVATLLDKSEGAIKSLQHRALAALRRAIDKEGCYETRD